MIIIDSIMKVEYIIVFEAAKEAFWFKKLVAELDVMPLHYTVTTIAP